MKKKNQLTTGLCATILALSLATTTLADEHTLPSAEHQDRTSLVPVSTESSELVASPVEESTTSLVTPVDPRISEVRVIHRRRTLKPDFSPVASSTDVVYKTVETRAITEYDISGNGPASVINENGNHSTA